MYLLIKYIKSVLWREAKRLSCIEDAWCLKVNRVFVNVFHIMSLKVIQFRSKRFACLMN